MYRLWNGYEAIIQLNDNLIEWKLTRNQSTNLSAVIMLSNCQAWQSNFHFKIKVEREQICVFPDYLNTIVYVGFPLLTAFDKSAFIANKKIFIVDFQLIEWSTVLDKYIILRPVVPNDDGSLLGFM